MAHLPIKTVETIRLERKMHDLVLVQAKNVYGNPLVYPVNTQAELLARIAGSKTLTQHTLQCAADMGFRIAQVVRSATIPVGDPRELFA